MTNACTRLNRAVLNAQDNTLVDGGAHETAAPERRSEVVDQLGVSVQ